MSPKPSNEQDYSKSDAGHTNFTGISSPVATTIITLLPPNPGIWGLMNTQNISYRKSNIRSIEEAIKLFIQTNLSIIKTKQVPMKLLRIQFHEINHKTQMMSELRVPIKVCQLMP